MNLQNINVDKCQREEKEVIEGICLSFDMVRGVCLETMQECIALVESDDISVV